VGLEDYQKSIEKQIMREMKIAHVFSIVLANMPHRLFKVFKEDEKMWRGCCYLLRGEIDYVALKNKISSLGGLYNLILRR